jgi:hypothetical protein
MAMGAVGARLRSEAGITMPELLVSMMIGLFVIGVAVAFFTAAGASEPRTTERATKIQQGRVAIERISRELRQGYGIPQAEPTQMTILTFVKRAVCGSTEPGPARRCRVIYSCDAGGNCSRTEREPDGGGSAPATEVVSGLGDNQVFTYENDPTGIQPPYIGIRLLFAATGGDEEAITLEDGVALRNPPLGGPAE